MPMFPLGTVLFPYATLPLHVFEPRYRVMTRHVLDGGEVFGVVLIERGSEVGGGDVRLPVGTVARVIGAAELADGGYALQTVGVRRIRVVEWLPDDPYPQAHVVTLAEPASEPSDTDLCDRVEAKLGRVADLARRIDPRIGPLPLLDSDPVRASYEAAALAPIGAYDAQRVLEAATAAERLELLASLLDEHAEALRARLDFRGE